MTKPPHPTLSNKNEHRTHKISSQKGDIVSWKKIETLLSENILAYGTVM